MASTYKDNAFYIPQIHTPPFIIHFRTVDCACIQNILIEKKNILLNYCLVNFL